MKLFLVIFGVFTCFYANAQTSSKDVAFILSEFPRGNYMQYMVKEVAFYGLKESGSDVDRNVKFFSISRDEMTVAIALIYKEFEGRDIKSQRVLFIPRKNSGGEIWEAFLNEIYQLNNVNEVKTIVYSLVKFQSDYYN